MNDKDKTSIQISRNTKEELDKIGKKGDTYDSIVRRLIKSGHENRSA